MALAEGKVASDEQQRKHAMDLRTLYVRFKKSHPEGAKKSPIIMLTVIFTSRAGQVLLRLLLLLLQVTFTNLDPDHPDHPFTI